MTVMAVYPQGFVSNDPRRLGLAIVLALLLLILMLLFFTITDVLQLLVFRVTVDVLVYHV